MRAKAIQNLLRSRLGLAADLASAARHRAVLEAEFVEDAPPLCMLPGMLDRVTQGVDGHSTAEEEVERAWAETFAHAPVIQYVLNDCLVHPGGVEYNGGSICKSPGFLQRIPTGRIERTSLRHYCMSRVSQQYFGHWLSDSCATALLAPNSQDIVLDARPDWPDTARYAKEFGLRTCPPMPERVAELHVYQDFSQGMLKRGRYEELRARLRAAMPATPDAANAVYLRRGNTGIARTIANEDALCNALAARGFDIVEVTGIGFEERYRRLSAATLLVTVDGSQVNHGFFTMHKGGGVISLTPSDRFTMRERGVTHAMGLRYGCVVISPGPDGYVVDTSEVLRTIDLFG